MSIIAPDFKHGANFKIGHNVIIEPDVIVGCGVELGNNVILMSGTRINSNVIMADYCCTTGACIIGNNVNIRTRTTISKCVIVEDNVFIGGGVMTSHTKHVPHCRDKVKSVQYLLRVGYGSIIGSHTILMAGVKIAPNSIIGGGSVVVRDTVKPGMYIGSPVEKIGNVPAEYWVSGKSAKYDFSPDVIEKYLPNMLVDVKPNKNIAHREIVEYIYLP